jgi:hypothetical protein
MAGLVQACPGYPRGHAPRVPSHFEHWPTQDFDEAELWRILSQTCDCAERRAAWMTGTSPVMTNCPQICPGFEPQTATQPPSRVRSDASEHERRSVMARRDSPSRDARVSTGDGRVAIPGERRALDAPLDRLVGLWPPRDDSLFGSCSPRPFSLFGPLPALKTEQRGRFSFSSSRLSLLLSSFRVILMKRVKGWRLFMIADARGALCPTWRPQAARARKGNGGPSKDRG